jgi:hypothetical protein
MMGKNTAFLDEDMNMLNFFETTNESVDELFGMVSSVVEEQPSELEPTPIGRNVVSVAKVPLAAAPWQNDKCFFESLRLFLKENPAPSEYDPMMLQSRVAATCIKKYATMGRCHKECQPSACSTHTCDSSESGDSDYLTFRRSHLEQWSQRYHELTQFHQEFSHCLVPLNWHRSPSLAHWVKRQRYQHRVKREGKHSTMTEERQGALESLGFIWDSHSAGWEERWNELREFKERHGHCKVPKKFPENPQLAVWVKCQRRQFKLFGEGKNSKMMTKERIKKLQILGFVFFNPRLKKNKYL